MLVGQLQALQGHLDERRKGTAERDGRIEWGGSGGGGGGGDTPPRMFFEIEHTETWYMYFHSWHEKNRTIIV